jgi:thiamine-monophosphate kinase
VNLISTDSYVEGVHFDMVYTPLQHLGYKCIAATISDIYAMNGTATHVVIAIALSSKYTLEALDELYKGMHHACKAFNVDIVGGDTTSTRSGMMITVTALGYADKEKIVYRSGAGQNDLLCVTGDLGGAYIGLQVLEREKRIFLEQPDFKPELTGFDYVLRRQLRPEARKDVVDMFASLGLMPTSMIDISDGLASEAMHLATQSGTGCRIYEEKIPMDDNTRETAIKFNIDPTVCALNGGEDYELLFTIRQEDHDKVKNHPDFTVIGHMTAADEGCRLITTSGGAHELKAQGWKHF